MFQPPERSAERDTAIEALLPNVPFDGWTMAALRGAAGPDADLLFPGGVLDMVEAYCDLGDRWMEQGAAAGEFPDEADFAQAAAIHQRAGTKARDVARGGCRHGRRHILRQGEDGLETDIFAHDRKSMVRLVKNG